MSLSSRKVVGITATLLSSAVLCPSLAHAEPSYFDDTLDTEVTLSQWKERNRNIEDITVLPSHAAQTHIDNYQGLECADFSIEAPQGWGSFHNASTGVVGVIPPEDAQPGDYDVKVTDSSECFPQDTYTSKMKVHVEKPSIQYHLDDAGNITGEKSDGTIENLGNIYHDDFHDDSISSVDGKEKGVAVITDNMGVKHTVYSHKNHHPSYKDNDSKGISSLDVNNGQATITATDGSVYVIDIASEKGNTQPGILDMGVVGKGTLYVVDTSGTSYNLGAIQQGRLDGVNSISYNKTIGTGVTTTTGAESYVHKDNGVSSISTKKDAVEFSTVKGKDSSISLKNNKNSSGFKNNDTSPRNMGNPQDGGVFKRNGYTYKPVEKEEKERSLWEKFVDIFL